MTSTGMQFDVFGHLVPYEKLVVTPAVFKHTFVDTLPNNSVRWAIYADYQQFVADLKSLIPAPFMHWIDGSFVTQKEEPADMDVITFFDHAVVAEYESLIRERFRRSLARKYYPLLDAYVVDVFPESHPSHFFTLSDEVYWLNWFTKTKPTRLRRPLPKGFMSIIYDVL